MTTDLYCRTCGKFLNPEGMSQITEWKRGRALFLNKRSGTAHEFLSEADSNKKRELPQPEPTSAIILKETGEIPAPNPPQDSASITPDNPDVETVQAAEEGEASSDESPLPEWLPGPSEWFYATVIKISNSYSYMLAELTNHEFVFVSEDVMRSPQHPSNCKPGDFLHVQIALNQRPGSRAKWWAHDAWREEKDKQEDGAVIRF